MTILFIVLLLLTIALQSSALSQAKPICYTGSSLYQLVTQNCHDQDPSYNGTWYCSTMEICEPYKSKERSCVHSRGCAKFEECYNKYSTTGVYNGQPVQTDTGINPVGMQITATCCQAYSFPTDDAVALDYSNICNASVQKYVLSFTIILVSMLIFLMNSM